MDFKRIEWIFLIAFFGLNIFLLSIYREGMSENSLSESSVRESIETRLEQDNINYGSELSTKKHEGYFLSGEETNLMEMLATAEDTNPLFFKNYWEVADDVLYCRMQQNYYVDKEDVKSSVVTFLNHPSAVVNGTEYQYIKELSVVSKDYSEIIVGQFYEEIPFNDETARIKIVLENAGDLLKVSQYTQTHIDNIEPLREKQVLSSEREAINTLYTNSKIPSNSKISWTKLAYSKILKVREKNVYVPVWFVGITVDGNTQVEAVNATNNTVITTTSIPTVES